MKKKQLAWIGCSIGVILLCVLTFSPLIIPTDVNTPQVWGLPRTLWAGLLVYGLMVLLTFVGTRVHPDIREPKGDDS